MHWRMGAEQLYISPHVVAFMGGGQLLLHHSAALASYCCTIPSRCILTALIAWPVLVHFLLVPRRWYNTSLLEAPAAPAAPATTTLLLPCCSVREIYIIILNIPTHQ